MFRRRRTARGLGALTLLSAVVLLHLSRPQNAGAAWPYPTSPFVVAAAPTGLGQWPFTVSPGSLLDSLWVGREGEVMLFGPESDGTLVPQREIPLPAGARPISVVGTGVGTLVLDAAHDSLLVFANDASTAPVLSLPVGPGAAALAVGYGPPVGSPISGPTIAVANAGSGDVSLFALRAGAVVGPERRVAVGATPVALAFADLTRDGVTDLAVADAGSGSISVLTGADVDHLAPRFRVPVGGTPSSLAVANVDGGQVPDLLVGDAAAPRIAQILWSAQGPTVGPEIPLPDAASRASSLVAASVDHDDFPDLAYADRGTRTVQVAHGTADGHFGPAVVVRSDVDAAAVYVGRLGGDFQRDFALADVRTQSVMLLLTPGDRFLSARPGATHLAADSGLLAWSQARGARDYRLGLWNGAVAREAPIAPSTRAFAPHIGRRAPQHPVVSYVRCRARSCQPFTWDIAQQRERRLHIAVASGCRIDDAAVWDDILAYLVRAVDHRCAARARGLWLRRSGQRPRRLAVLATIGALQAGRLAWKDFQPSRYTARLRILKVGRHARTLDRENVENALSAPTLDGPYVYWTRSTSELDHGHPPLVRQPTETPGCEEEWPRASDFGLPTRGELLNTGDFAVDHGRLFYVDDSGVFQADPSRVHWPGACATS